MEIILNIDEEMYKEIAALCESYHTGTADEILQSALDKGIQIFTTELMQIVIDGMTERLGGFKD